MTIDNSGNVLIGTTSTNPTNGFTVTGVDAATVIQVNHASGVASGAYYADFRYNLSTIGRIQQHGTSAVQYITTSDYRLKEDIQPMVGASERVLALNPINFAWKVDGSRVDGFLAHEAQEVVPECISGTKDEMRDEEYEVSAALGEVFTPAIDGIDEVTETVVVTQAVEAQDAVTGERPVMETIETGSYVNLAGETIIETREVGITEEATETVIERQATALGEVFTAGVEGVDEVAETIIVTQAIEAQSEVTETVIVVPAIAAQDAVMSERQVMETIETGTYVNLAGETITETREVGVTEEATETAIERQDIDGIMTEVEVERTVQVAVMEEYEVRPAIEAVAEVTEERIITESVEAVAEVTEERIITESVEAVAEVVLETDVERPAELEEDQQWREMTAGVMTEVEVERTIQVAVMEAYEVSPAIEAVTEVTEVNVITESVEAIAEVVLETDVERPTEFTEQQQWRETAEQVMATREVPEMQGIDQGKIVPLLTAALQEALARIAALEATQ
jgi:nicotinamidase-related amidase